MNDLEITLRSDLCAGNGESSGDEVDTDLCTDAFGFPVIPARRLKGCLRQAAEWIAANSPDTLSPAAVTDLFGVSGEREGTLRIRDAHLADEADWKAGLQAVDAEKMPLLAAAAHPAGIKALFTTVRGQTKLEKGVAAEGSLRYTRVLNHYRPDGTKENVFCAPLEFEENDLENVQKICAALRHIGTHRNRGLGVVQCRLRTCKDKGRTGHAKLCLPNSKRICLSYTVSLDAPLSLPELGRESSVVPGASVIGCMAAQYLRQNQPGTEFDALFTTGETCWSALTPVIEGKISVPTPLYLVYLKNKGRYASRYETAVRTDITKQKTLDGTFLSDAGEGSMRLAVPQMQAIYHNNRRDQKLYTQTALREGQVFGGTVTVKRENAETVCNLLHTALLRFGRSKGAQYATCTLQSLQATPCEDTRITFAGNICIVLQSDLLVTENGCYTVENEAVRRAIAQKLNIPDARPEGENDWCAYRTVGGFHGQWKLQKPQRPLVCGGSVYCFALDAPTELPLQFRLGELPQEGMGLCRVCAMDALAAPCSVIKTTVSSFSAAVEADNRWKDFAAELLLRRAKERLILSAQSYADSHRTALKNLNDSFVGRLSLMLMECDNDFKNYVNRVRSIKNDGKCKESFSLLSGLLCDQPFPAIHVKRTALDTLETELLAGAPNAEAMLRDELELYRELCVLLGKDDAEGSISALWPAMVETVLTFAKYMLRRKEDDENA